MFIACRRFRVRRKGKYEWTIPGEELPEAEHWPNLESCIRSGYIREVKKTKKEDLKPEKKPLPPLDERKQFGSEKHYRDVEVEKKPKSESKSKKKKKKKRVSVFADKG